jgi:diguanylate cyclase (GGDEF)-like protein
VLSCPTLPSLPGVAVRVLELTRDPSVSMQAIAQTVQGDPALAIKVLKTVNSSYYGLSVPCPSISRAMSLLGLNTVKSIVLGFSLLDCTKSAGSDGRFDMSSYWRRAVYTAAAARAIAQRSGRCDAEEVFVAGLVQDIGMLACFAAIKDAYLEVLQVAPADHDQLARVEREKLGFDHAHVGRLLAERWRLPAALQDCIGTHHNIKACKPAHEPMVRVVHLAGLAGAVLITAEPSRMNEFVSRAHDWLGFEPPQTHQLLDQCARGASDLSKALELKLSTPNVESILSQAREQMVVVQEAVQQEAAQLRANNDRLTRQTITDGLTGAFNRTHFDQQLHACFDATRASRKPLSLVFIDGDRFKAVNDTHGHQAGDAVLMVLAQRLKDACGQRAQVFRYGGEEFAILLPGVGPDAAMRFAEQVRCTISGKPFDLRPHQIDLSLPITISLGVCGVEGQDADRVTPDRLLRGADRAVYAAKAAGRNSVRVQEVAGPDVELDGALGPSTPQPATPEPRSVLIVEDDPLAARLMSFLFSKAKHISPVVVKSGEEALQWVGERANPSPGLVVCDLNLPGVSGVSLIKLVRDASPKRRVPFLIVTAAADAANQSAALAAGADAFIDKAEFCTNSDHWLDVVTKLMGSAKAAA